MYKLLKLLKPYKLYCFLGPFFKFAEAFIELFIPVIVANIIDVGITFGNTKYILLRISVMLLLALLCFIFAVLGQYYSAKAAVFFSSELRSAVFTKINRLSFKKLDSIGTSTFITRLTGDINQIQTGVNLFLRLILRSPLVVIGALVMAFFISAKMAIIFLVAVALLYAVVFVIMFTLVPKYKKVQERLDKITEITRDNLSGIRVVRAFCKEKSEYEEFCNASQNYANESIKTGNLASLQDPISFFIINFAIIAIVYFGAVNVNIGALTTGAIVALYNYMSNILIEIVKFGRLVITLTKSIASAKRVEEVLNQEEEKDTAVTPLTAVNSIEFKDVCFSYNGISNQIKNISFTAKSGETIGIIGGTGSGKTTIINLLCGNYTVNSGKILINGKSIYSYTAKSIKQLFSVAMQKAVLFKGSIKDNLLWGNKNATEQQIDLALNTACADFCKDFEGGINYALTENGKNISGGQRQRLNIARAIIKNPQVLVLDDSFSALDYATDLKIRKNLSKNKANITFIISQRASSVITADKIIVLQDGNAVGIGNHDSLLSSCSIYREIYYTQYERQGAKND